MNKKEIAQQFTKQMLDPNQPSISFEQVTNMLKEIEQTHSEIMSNTEAYRIQHRILDISFQTFIPTSSLHELQGLHKPIENLEERLTNVINTVIKIPKVLPLATLLDSTYGGGDLGPVNQSPVDDSMKKNKKKKRKRLRL